MKFCPVDTANRVALPPPDGGVPVCCISVTPGLNEIEPEPVTLNVMVPVSGG